MRSAMTREGELTDGLYPSGPARLLFLLHSAGESANLNIRRLALSCQQCQTP